MKKQDKPFAKTEAQYFADWESAVFGYGYGTGEKHTLQALKDFLEAFDHQYDFQELGEKLGGQITWLLINTLAKSDIIEYGTSPRFGWLSSSGDLLQAFVKKHTVDDLYDFIMCDDDYQKSAYAYCDFNFCNCYPEQTKKKCRNNYFLNEKVADDLLYKQQPHE